MRRLTCSRASARALTQARGEIPFLVAQFQCVHPDVDVMAQRLQSYIHHPCRSARASCERPVPASVDLHWTVIITRRLRVARRLGGLG